MKKLLSVAALIFTTSLALSAQELISLDGSLATIRLQDGKQMTVDFYGPDIVRLFLDPENGPLRDPEATPPARILADNPRIDPGKVKAMAFGDEGIRIDTDGLALIIAGDGSFRFRRNAPLMKSLVPANRWYQGRISFSPTGTTLTLTGISEDADYSCDVCSPAPWFWSTDGIGVLWHTFAKGSYRFGPKEIVLQHETPYLDVFILEGEKAEYTAASSMLDNVLTPNKPSREDLASIQVRMLNLYDQLTGNPELTAPDNRDDGLRRPMQGR